jgi:hypothetical protein
VNSHSVKGCTVTIAEAMWEADVYNIPKSFTFKNVAPDPNRPLACNTVKIFGAGIKKGVGYDLRFVCRLVWADRGAVDILGKGGEG